MPDVSITYAPVPDRALVVDDDAGICAVLVSLLRHAGWDVMAATRFEEAKAVVEDRTRPLNLAILDIRLPDGDGMDLIPLIQARRDRPDVVLMTGFATDQAYLRAIRLGVLDMLTKPFTPSNVGEMLRNRQVRERQRLGIMVERFERVDDEFATVHRELHDIREILNAWEAAQGLTTRRTRGAT